jgi:hypothetical protein
MSFAPKFSNQRLFSLDTRLHGVNLDTTLLNQCAQFFHYHTLKLLEERLLVAVLFEKHFTM